MIKQLFLPFLGVFLFVAFVGILVTNPQKLGINPKPTPVTDRVVEIKFKNVTVKAKLADSASSRKTGLSGVKSLNPNEGMLFVFGSKNVSPSFWMKGMLIPLDIIWINDNQIVKIDKKVLAPDPETDDSDLKVYSSQEPVDYVLEVNSGFSDKNGLKVGGEMQFDL